MLKRSPIWRSSPKDWAHTLRIPASDFPGQPDPRLRPQLTQSCTDDLYAWQSSARRAGHAFTLHDGPPYANGDLHIGHALNKILKDIFNRFQLSQGKRVNYRPGWDCHGLPIELKALQKLGQRKDGKNLTPDTIRIAASCLAADTIETQKQGFRSWGVMGDWEQPYSTMSRSFELKQLEVFKTLVEKGLIYRQHKPVHWSPSSETALAEAELEYDERHVSNAAYVKFRVTELSPALPTLDPSLPTFALIWTTTPWTIPANKAIAVHPDMDYLVIQHNSEQLIVGNARLAEVTAALQVQVEDIRILTKLKGVDLVSSAKYMNGFQGRKAQSQPFLPADYVSSEAGTGLVHTAPGHGHDDYDLCRQHNIATFAPVDNLGRFTHEAMPDHLEFLDGKRVLTEGNKAVLAILSSDSNPWNMPKLLSTYKYQHRYPIDWRTKLPVIIRATAQWFADVEDVKSSAIQAIEGVKFTPESGKSRLRSFVLGRSQWCISRQRAWGVPIPVLYRTTDGQDEAVMTPGTVSHIISVIQERGTDAWWTDAEDDPAWVAPDLPPGKYIRGKDTMDVWFDSGTTWTQLDEQMNSDGYLADVYLEGSDQHRGWFQSSLLTRISSQATPGADSNVKAPFQRLITHGFVLDDKGQKMSKSIGNVVSPAQIMDGTLIPPIRLRGQAKKEAQEPLYWAMGPDILRLWVAKNDYTHDVPVGKYVLRGVNSALRKYRITLKWLLGVLHDYGSIGTSTVSESSLDLSSRLALLHLTTVEQRVHDAYSSYEPYRAMREMERYVNVDLSAFYFETAKDVIYTSTEADRLRAQYVCHKILQSLLVMLAPTTPLLVAETLHYASPGLRASLEDEGNHPLRRVWQPAPTFDHSGDYEIPLAQQNECIDTLRQAVNHAQEKLRTAKHIGSSLNSSVHIRPLDPSASTPAARFLQQAVDTGEAAAALVVSEVRFGAQLADVDTDVSVTQEFALGEGDEEGRFAVTVSRVDASKCPRCWRFAIPREEVRLPEFGAGRQVCKRCTSALEEQQARVYE